jgi:hypothetical protein
VTNIVEYIENEIVVSSGDAIKYCVETLGITNEAARKRLQRLPAYIYKVKGICRDGQSILYHEKNWNNPDFLDKLCDVIKNNSHQHYALLNAINLYYGAVPKEILAEYSVNPTGNIKGHKNFNTIVTDLLRLRLIQENEDLNVLSECYVCREDRARALNIIQKTTLAHFFEWGRNIGLFSYDSAKFHSELSSYQFAMVAPSYITSLVSESKNGKTIPAFVVADILLNRDIKKEDVIFFVKKLENTLMRNHNAKIIPILLIGTHDKDVYHILKSNGVIVGNIDELFGDKYSESLYGILNLIENAGAILKSNPDQYLKLIDSIEKLSTGKTYNLKGDLFEMAVGYYHGQLCNSLEISKKIRHDNNIREIDVYAVYADKVVFAECKGYNSKIDDAYIEQWLSKKVSVIRQWALSCDCLCDKKIVFEIWSTGGFTDEATTRLTTAHQRTKKYQVDFYDYNAMLQIAKEKNIRHFVEIVNSYYTKEL